MRHYLIISRSLTYAQRSLRVLERAGIGAVIAKAPAEYATQGCTYGVKLRESDLPAARGLLDAEHLLRDKIIALPESGWGSGGK